MRTKRSAAVMILSAVAVACSDSALPTDPFNEEVSALQARAGGPPKATVCHLDRELNLWKRLEVGRPALRAHLRHGDGQPGDPVPGADGYEFDDDCVPAPILIGRILFNSNRDVVNRDHYIMNPDGSGQMPFLVDPRTVTGSSDVSLDGTKVAITLDSDVFTLAVNSSDPPTRLTFSSGSNDGGPAWSPDGTRIAYYPAVGGLGNEVFVMNADGSGMTNLTLSPGSDAGPDWSPDGTLIAFESSRTGASDIYFIAPDGTGLERFTDHPDPEFNPAWSPDGTLIAYQRVEGGVTDVWVMPVDRSEDPRRLTETPAFDGQPRWSPDGRFIAFMSQRDGNREIYVMKADGTHEVNITRHPAEDHSPAWGCFPGSC